MRRRHVSRRARARRETLDKAAASLRQTDTHGVAIGSYSRYVFFWAGLFFTTYSTLYLVPIAVGLALLQSSLYDVPGGFKAVMFDRFSGVKGQVCLWPLSMWNAWVG
jgi:hypothetical protein